MDGNKKEFELKDFLSFQLERVQERTDNMLVQFDELEDIMSEHNGPSPVLEEMHDIMEKAVNQSIRLVEYLEFQLLRIELDKEPLTAVMNPMPFPVATKILLSFL